MLPYRILLLLVVVFLMFWGRGGFLDHNIFSKYYTSTFLFLYHVIGYYKTRVFKGKGLSQKEDWYLRQGKHQKHKDVKHHGIY